MGKEKLTLYVEGDVKTQAKRELDNLSSIASDAFRQHLRIEESGLESRIEDIEEEIEEVEEEIDNKKMERSQLKASLRALKEQKKSEDQPSDEMERFREVFEKQDWRKPEQIPDYWRRELDKSKEELFQEVTEE